MLVFVRISYALRSQQLHDHAQIYGRIIGAALPHSPNPPYSVISAYTAERRFFTAINSFLSREADVRYYR